MHMYFHVYVAYVYMYYNVTASGALDLPMHHGIVHDCRAHEREALNEGSILMMYVRMYVRVRHNQECR